MTGNETVALVGVAGGAGATRLSVEVAATLARDGRDAVVLDAAFATQGLSQHVTDHADPDLTAVVVDDRPLDAALLDHPADTPGRFALAPAFAPFERLARAKTPAAAERFADATADAASEFDHVLVDAPPIAANQAVAAVTAADRVALVAPDSARGADSLQRARGRLAGVGEAADLVVVNRAGDDPLADADVAVPPAAAGVPETPTAVARPDGEFAPAVAALAEALFDADLDLAFESAGALDAAKRRLAGVRSRAGRLTNS
jgi:MinD-like ATPase involved in chromosome partitioning or flagellar assembly